MRCRAGVGGAAYARLMRTQRALVDYALQRRALLADISRGRIAVTEVCDASRYLLQAAKFYGVVTDAVCPVCRKEPLTHVHWVYGDELGPMAGSARPPGELEQMAFRFGEFTVYQVEVCRTCSWNHLVASFQLGKADIGSSRRPRRAAR